MGVGGLRAPNKLPAEGEGEGEGAKDGRGPALACVVGRGNYKKVERGGTLMSDGRFGLRFADAESPLGFIRLISGVATGLEKPKKSLFSTEGVSTGGVNPNREGVCCAAGCSTSETWGAFTGGCSGGSSLEVVSLLG